MDHHALSSFAPRSFGHEAWRTGEATSIDLEPAVDLLGSSWRAGRDHIQSSWDSPDPHWKARIARLVAGVRHEASVTYRIVWRDLSASLIPATLMSLAALFTQVDWTPIDLLRTIAFSVLYFSLYIYSFCLSNQIVGFDEDRVNKPDRVLPSGTISMRGARNRWFISMLIFPLMGFALGGFALLRWAVAWQVIFLSYNHLGLHRHWFTKNVVFITLGTLVQLAAAWELVSPLTLASWQWIAVVSVAFGVTLHIQDLRDVEGDRAVGRHTLPVAIGQSATRRVMAIAIALLPILCHFFLFSMAKPSVSIACCEVGLSVLNAIVSVRLIRKTSISDDHCTYMLHTYWFCAVLAAAWFVI